jgi:hypothetical protein
MFLAPAVLIGLVAGLLLGGRLSRLAELRLRAQWLFFAAIGLQLIAYPPFIAVRPGDGVATALQVVSYGCLVAVTLVNVRLTGMAIAGAGMLCNLAAILANGGHMPGLPSALAGAGLTYDGVRNNSVRDAQPNLPWLVDRWAAPDWLPWGTVFSVGDVLLAVGVAVVIAAAMGPRVPWRAVRPAAG